MSSDWRDLAACIGQDPDLFWPVGDSAWVKQQTARAKVICARCPVVDECLALGVQLDEHDGIWGGTTKDERKHYCKVCVAFIPNPHGPQKYCSQTCANTAHRGQKKAHDRIRRGAA